MKFILSLLAMLTITVTGFSQKGVYVKYETEIFATGEEAEMMSMMMNGSTMEVASSENRTWVKTQMGTMITMTMEMDSESEEMTMLMSGLAGTMAFQGNPKELEPEEEEELTEEEEPELVITDETKVILDYECTKATITDEEGNVATYWYTEKIQRPDGVSQMPNQVPGLCLEFEVTMQEGMKVVYTAVDADKKISMEDFTVEIPEGVDIMPLSKLATMGMAGL